MFKKISYNFILYLFPVLQKTLGAPVAGYDVKGANIAESYFKNEISACLQLCEQTKTCMTVVFAVNQQTCYYKNYNSTSVSLTKCNFCHYAEMVL